VGELAEIPKSETQQAIERMDAVERQLHRHLPPGVQRIILCPYCEMWNFPASRVFCCELLRFAVVTVLVADRAMEALESGERAMDS
jgi:hypothetical protein